MNYLILTLSIILVIAIAIMIGNYNFHKKVNKEIEQIRKQLIVMDDKTVTYEDIAALPMPVQKWMIASGIIGKKSKGYIPLLQEGKMKLNPEGKWVPFQAQQFITTSPIAMIWKVRVKMNPIVFITGRDMYYEGHGNMRIKLFSLFPVVNAKGAEIDQGILQRYLAEMIWYPNAAIIDTIKWVEIDERSATATMTYKGVTGSCTFYFNKDNLPERIEALRYYDNRGKYSLEKWLVTMGDYQERNEMMIPIMGNVYWCLPEQEFHWFQCIIK